MKIIKNMYKYFFFFFLGGGGRGWVGWGSGWMGTEK